MCTSLVCFCWLPPLTEFDSKFQSPVLQPLLPSTCFLSCLLPSPSLLDTCHPELPVCLLLLQKPQVRARRLLSHSLGTNHKGKAHLSSEVWNIFLSDKFTIPLEVAPVEILVTLTLDTSSTSVLVSLSSGLLHPAGSPYWFRFSLAPS